ncbi:MAG: integrase core domain-containing protein [Candidatus Woykebacteria bacterium]
MAIDWRLEVFIKALRVKYGRLSKYKIKIFLDEYAKSLGIASYGVTKINKIIKRRHYYFYGKTKVKRRTGGAIKRLRRTPKETVPGYLQMDSITVYVTSQKYYFVSVIDIVTKFAWCSLVASSTAKNSTVTLEKFQANYPYPVRVIQTDNGHEFLGDFQAYCEERSIPPEFIYPRSPKINGVVGRFNQTVQEEFITRADELYYNRSGFEEKLTKYLTWYNNSRPHHSLNLRTPVAYLKEF